MNHKPTVVFISTYPPRECGIATFTQDLLQATQKLFTPKTQCYVAANNLSAFDTYKYPKEVKWQINQNSRTDYRALAIELNNTPNIVGVLIQHEYGIFGGQDGENILSFINTYKKPFIITLHTVIPDPSQHMFEVTQKLIKHANLLIVLTDNSKGIIEKLYPNAKGKIHVIPHGIHEIKFALPNKAKQKLNLQDNTILSTFGLLSSGKGIEYVINALPPVVKKYPNIRYHILGQTHPVIRRKDGEKYRLHLLDLVKKLHLKKNVKFFDQYFEISDLLKYLQATDIYISTSINPDQAVSGTLSYALGTGRAVISTDFPQAREIITDNVGRLVPVKDTQAFTQKILELLNDPEHLRDMYQNAYQITRPMLWSNVSLQVYNLFQNLESHFKAQTFQIPEINLTHLIKMTDDIGLFQFAKLSTPNPKFGYTLDDNARALVACAQLQKNEKNQQIDKLINIYINFIKRCQLSDGSFTNYINHSDQQATHQNNIEDIEESQARALWGLTTVINTPEISLSTINIARNICIKTLKNIDKFHHLRTQALTMKSIALLLQAMPEASDQVLPSIQKYANQLNSALQKNSQNDWIWFENYLGYNNGILPEALLIAGHLINNDEYIQNAKKALEFLIKETFYEDVFYPIGNEQWYVRGKKRSYYDQQPEDPCSMILALTTAFKYTQNYRYHELARICFSWYLGNNSLKIALYSTLNGGCFDGLQTRNANRNQGAESLIAYILSRNAISE